MFARKRQARTMNQPNDRRAAQPANPGDVVDRRSGLDRRDLQDPDDALPQGSNADEAPDADAPTSSAPPKKAR